MALANQVKEDYETNGFEAMLMPVDDACLNDLLTASIWAASIADILHWYDDGSRTVTWMEIEGEGYGWAFMQRPESQWNLMMRERVAAYVTEAKAERDPDASVVIARNDKQTIYHFIERTACAYDHLFVLNQEKKGGSHYE